MNRFNKTETAIFPMQVVVSEDFPFSLFIGLNVCGYNFFGGHVVCVSSRKKHDV